MVVALRVINQNFPDLTDRENQGCRLSRQTLSLAHLSLAAKQHLAGRLQQRQSCGNNRSQSWLCRHDPFIQAVRCSNEVGGGARWFLFVYFGNKMSFFKRAVFVVLFGRSR